MNMKKLLSLVLAMLLALSALAFAILPFCGRS